MSYNTYGPEPTPAPREGRPASARPGRRRRSATGSAPRAVPAPPPRGPRPGFDGRPSDPGRAARPGRRPEAAFEDTQAMMMAATGPTEPRPPVAGRGPAGRTRPPRPRRGPTGPGGEGPGGHDGRDDKPRKRGWRRFVPSWKIVMAGFAVFTAGVFGMIAVAYANTPLPTTTQDDVDDQGSIIYYDNGKVLARLGVKRTPVTIDKIPIEVQDAVIAAENRTFREDHGIDFRGMLRSIWSTATGQQVQGASTITQQMARNYYDGLSKEVSINRKVKEIFVAIKLDKTLTKEEILTQYLNTIYFGRGAYGIQAAAQEFFRKNVKDLTVQEGAYLAGRIQNPSRFDVAEQKGDMSLTEERYRYVIEGLAEMNPEKYGSLPKTSPTSPKRAAPRSADVYKGLKGYMITEVLKELQKKGISEEDVKKGGYRIYSTFNERLMKLAKKAVLENTADLPKQVHTGLAAVDPRNGRLRAFYGGKDFMKDQWNEATMSQKQAASAFKPYVLAAWLDSGYSLDSYLPGRGEVKLPGTTPITNDHDGPASVNVIRATAASVNTAFAKMAEKVGLDKVIEIASAAGLDRARLEDAESRHHYLIAIGSSQVTPVEQAAGYSIFANHGKHYETHVVIKVLNRQKQVVIKEPTTPKQVISPEAAADAVVALQEVVKSGTGRGASLGARPVAGKTGTNNENKEAWFVGFTPQLSTAVGMYKEVNGKEVSLGNIQGATYPTRVWRAFMAEALANAKIEPFPERANVGTPTNLAPKPTPTPTPEDDEPFTDPDFRSDVDTDWPELDERPFREQQEEDQFCFPWDERCNGDNDPFGGNVPSPRTANGRDPAGG